MIRFSIPAEARGLTSAVLLILSALLFPRQASAKGCNRGHDRGFVFGEGYVGTLSLPPLAVNGGDAPRRLVGLPSPASSQMVAGVGAGFEFRCDYVVYDVISLRYTVGVDGGVSGSAAADGGTATASRGPMSALAIGLPLFGLPSGFQVFPTDASKITFKLDVGFERIAASATVSSTLVPSATTSLESWGGYLRAQIGACMLVGRPVEDVSTAWGCATLTPIVYDQGVFPGVTLGVRVDL